MNPAKTSTYIKTQATARHAYPGDILETERFNTTLHKDLFTRPVPAAISNHLISTESVLNQSHCGCVAACTPL
jgi:hypothetical protein